MFAFASSPLAFGCFVVLALLVGCASPVVKRKVFDADVVSHRALPADLLSEGEDLETVVDPAIGWMATDTVYNIVFVGYRPPSGAQLFYCQVLSCEPDSDSIVLHPLLPGEDPVAALANPRRVESMRQNSRAWAAGQRDGIAGYLELSLQDVVDNKRLGPPLRTPRRILATAANFPSHLQHDLAVEPEMFAGIATSRPRVFQKHPPCAAPAKNPERDLHPNAFKGVIGPFDDVRYPERIHLPKNEEGEFYDVETNLDYEVEIGMVIGRRLDWDTVSEMSDAELYRSVAGYVLVSDVKARNPQLFERAVARDEEVAGASPYLTGNAAVDDVLGDWTQEICQWWSYAASQGDYASLGPFFVANPGEETMPPRAMLCARTYAEPEKRGSDIPRGRPTGVFFLRQCSRTSIEPGYRDALLWEIPAILRSIVNPVDNALDDNGESIVLEPGDVVSLGTPGGVVLTVTDRSLVKFLDFVLFWWDALDWHDAFFGKDHEKYLREGDQLLMWAEGLGFQRNHIVADGSEAEASDGE